MTQFSGKVAFVSGGSTGIGRATAVAFAREGAKVVVAARNADKSIKTVEMVKEAGSDGLFIQTDVTQADQVESAIQKTVDAYGRLDFAFNNAGLGQHPLTPLAELSEDFADRIIATNLKGVWLCMKYEIQQMLKNGGGAIVNTSSMAGVIGTPGIGLYNATKHAVIGLTQTGALENAQNGIRINAVCPGIIETPMTVDLFGSEQKLKDQKMYPHPIGRNGQPEEIASAVLFLCSDAASLMTGHHLLLDGGYTVGPMIEMPRHSEQRGQNTLAGARVR